MLCIEASIESFVSQGIWQSFHERFGFHGRCGVTWTIAFSFAMMHFRLGNWIGTRKLAFVKAFVTLVLIGCFRGAFANLSRPALWLSRKHEFTVYTLFITEAFEVAQRLAVLGEWHGLIQEANANRKVHLCHKSWSICLYVYI